MRESDNEALVERDYSGLRNPKPKPVQSSSLSWKLIVAIRDGNFASSRLTRPSPLPSTRVFPIPQRWWGGYAVRFQPRTMGQGGDGFRVFRPTPPCPSPSPPRPALLRVIIVNFSYSKTLLFKQTYQYQLILFYLIWFSAFILLCVILRDFFLLNTWINYSIFSKN